MNRRCVWLLSWMTATVLSLCVLLSQLHAQEEEAVVISGRLTGYDTRSVFVDGERIEFCENAQVRDPRDMQILTDGLVATETVEVTLKRGCAIEVKAWEIRR